MLRQPQLHSSITRAHVHACAPHYLQSPTQHAHTHTHTHTRTHLRARIHNPAVAMGDRGVSARVWHALSQVAQENDDSWQLAVWHPPPKKKKSAPPPLPHRHPSRSPSLSVSPLFTSSHLSLSLSLSLFLTLSHACWLWSNNSTSTCLDSSTFMKITMWAACFSSCICFIFLALSVRLI